MSKLRDEMLVFQVLKILLRFLYFAVSFFAGSVKMEGADQACYTKGRKSSCCSQQFSNLKVLALGMRVLTSMTQGQWYEVSMIRDFAIVFGYLKV